MTEALEVDYLYEDTDSYENEIAELYSYSEGAEFQLNLKVSVIFLYVYFQCKLYLILAMLRNIIVFC